MQTYKSGQKCIFAHAKTTAFEKHLILLSIAEHLLFGLANPIVKYATSADQQETSKCWAYFLSWALSLFLIFQTTIIYYNADLPVTRLTAPY